MAWMQFSDEDSPDYSVSGAHHSNYDSEGALSFSPPPDALSGGLPNPLPSNRNRKAGGGGKKAAKAGAEQQQFQQHEQQQELQQQELREQELREQYEHEQQQYEQQQEELREQFEYQQQQQYDAQEYAQQQKSQRGLVDEEASGSEDSVVLGGVGGPPRKTPSMKKPGKSLPPAGKGVLKKKSSSPKAGGRKAKAGRGGRQVGFQDEGAYVDGVGDGSDVIANGIVDGESGEMGSPIPQHVFDQFGPSEVVDGAGGDPQYEEIIFVLCVGSSTSLAMSRHHVLFRFYAHLHQNIVFLHLCCSAWACMTGPALDSHGGSSMRLQHMRESSNDIACWIFRSFTTKHVDR